MIKELDLFGVFAPPLLGYVAIAAVVWQPLRILLERVGFYRTIWHPALFNVSIYVVILAAVMAVLK
ncbi:DUF1656 domain-containing protein [Hansschlegelia plantiphila]|uniref:DUF1656 domain-containing protein n=1 Tax=Hansschlegelia plantiphila TaxID=374655 RepID=A0A9W6MVW3_9HYPH|nr:DUF1656 domain-containing protein [Hansschlegelia plantiphila]GLK68428.1 DUF1656 domain-containing protein [Hansschlegelia plantiphila]